MVRAPSERRQYPRAAVRASSRVTHDASGRDFPCQCRDVSAGGASLAAPAVMPVRPGHTVRLQATEALRSLLGEAADDAMTAAVVRVDRQNLLTDGHIIIAVRFDTA